MYLAREELYIQGNNVLIICGCMTDYPYERVKTCELNFCVTLDKSFIKPLYDEAFFCNINEFFYN